MSLLLSKSFATTSRIAKARCSMSIMAFKVCMLSSFSSSVLATQKYTTENPATFNVPANSLFAPATATTTCSLASRYSFITGFQQHKCIHKTSENVCHSASGKDSGLPWTDIEYEQLMDMIKSRKIQLFDVREVEEIEETGMIPGATNIPLDSVAGALQLEPDEFKEMYGVDKPDKSDDDVVFNCLGGIRSKCALDAAHEAGFTKARHYIGGWDDYEEKSRGR